MRDWLLALFNNVDVRAVDNVCNNMGYELVVEDGKVTNYEIVKEENTNE